MTRNHLALKLVHALRQDRFLAKIKHMVTNRKTVKVEVDEGWYTADEMKVVLSWGACGTQLQDCGCNVTPP